MDKELDLSKFMKRMRLFQIATFGLLTNKQRVFAEKMSRMVIEEDHSELSAEQASDAESSNNLKETERIFVEKAVRKMVRSQDKTDQRFVNLHRTGRALTHKVPTGLKSCKDNFKDDLVED